MSFRVLLTGPIFLCSDLGTIPVYHAVGGEAGQQQRNMPLFSYSLLLHLAWKLGSTRAVIDAGFASHAVESRHRGVTP